MRDLTGFRKGIVRIRVQGEQTERFLNLCKARKIKISSLDRTGEQSLEGDFGIQDFLRLSPIRRKTGVKIHILEKHGRGTVHRRYWIFLRRRVLCMGCSGVRSAAMLLLRQSGKIIMILRGCRSE